MKHRATKSVVVFLSYCQDDDRHDGGFAQQFAKKLADEVRVQAGKKLELEVFFDKDSIKWGQAWTDRIEQGLAESAFLIPIVTPQFLDSRQCVREVQKFREIERQRNRNDLVLPLYYVADERVREDEGGNAADESDVVASFISGRQWIDWRPLRPKNWTDSDVKAQLQNAVTQLRAAINNRVEAASDAQRKAEDGVIDLVVDPNGDHHESFSEALAKCETGHRLILEPGTYELDAQEITRAIRIRGVGSPEQVVLRFTGNTGLHVQATSCVLENFTVDHANPKREGCAILWSGAKGSIVGCTVKSNGVACVQVEPKAGPRIRSCLLRGALYGVYARDDSSPEIEKCDISGASCAGVSCSMNAAPALKGSRIHGCGHAVWHRPGARGEFAPDNVLSGNWFGEWNSAAGTTTAAAALARP